MSAPALLICSYREAQRRRWDGWDAIISIASPGSADVVTMESPGSPRVTVLRFDNITEAQDGRQLAGAGDVARALDVGREVADGRLLVHCGGGYGRSPAIGLAILADRLGRDRDAAAVNALFEIVPAATPNRWVVQLADQMLARQGALVQALAERRT